MSQYLELLRDRILVYDGAMGTQIQDRNLSLSDYWDKEGCSEILVLSRPEVIREIHEDYLKVGADVVETNTFGATRIVLAEYDLQDKVAEINRAAVKLAKEACAKYSTPEKPRFVAGSIGPTTKLPSLGHITFDNMVAGYTEQAAALIEGGVDILLAETCQD
jgi:5-methyltetrahydrofolate--homocysteine methyltransferase